MVLGPGRNRLLKRAVGGDTRARLPAYVGRDGRIGTTEIADRARDFIRLIFLERKILRQIAGRIRNAFLSCAVGCIIAPAQSINPGVVNSESAVDGSFGALETHDHIGQLEGGVVAGIKVNLILVTGGNLLREGASGRDGGTRLAAHMGRNRLAGTHPIT